MMKGVCSAVQKNVKARGINDVRDASSQSPASTRLSFPLFQGSSSPSAALFLPLCVFSTESMGTGRLKVVRLKSPVL